MTDVENPVTVMFRWWNEAYTSNAFTEEGFARFFTADLEFVVNGNLRARSCAELAASFQRIRAATLSVRLCLPVEETFGVGDKVFVHYRVEAETEAGSALETAMAVATIADGRIARMIIVSHEAPAG